MEQLIRIFLEYEIEFRGKTPLSPYTIVIDCEPDSIVGDFYLSISRLTAPCYADIGYPYKLYANIPVGVVRIKEYEFLAYMNASFHYHLYPTRSSAADDMMKLYHAVAEKTYRQVFTELNVWGEVGGINVIKSIVLLIKERQ